MNERIKELCKEAAEVHLKTMSPKTHTTPLYLLDKLAQSARESGIEIVSDGFCEKFAELIIRECIKTIPMDIDPDVYLKVLRAIDDRFGVE